MSEAVDGRLLALDIGARRVGVAVSDERQIAVRPLPALRRTNWKALLQKVTVIIQELDVRGLVIGLPLRLDGTEGDAAHRMRRLARNFALSLEIPVFLQDERLTTRAAERYLRDSGETGPLAGERLDGVAAALILSDFIARLPPREAAAETPRASD